MPFGSSRIRSYSLTITLPRTVLYNAQPLVILRRVWKTAMSAVSFTGTERLRHRLHKHHSPGCGDVVDITNNGGTTAAETDCTTACSGDPLHLCGGAQRLQLYLWNGTLNNWQTPANVGGYEVRTKCLLFYTYMPCYKAIQRSTSSQASCLRCLPRSVKMARFPSLRKVARLYFRILLAHTNST